MILAETIVAACKASREALATEIIPIFESALQTAYIAGAALNHDVGFKDVIRDASERIVRLVEIAPKGRKP